MPDITASRPVSGQPIETGWGDQVHDLIEGVQTGSLNITFAAGTTSPAVAITFPRAYITPPTVIVCLQASGALYYVDLETAPTTTGVTVRAAHRDATATSVTVICHWIAVGTPA